MRDFRGCEACGILVKNGPEQMPIIKSVGGCEASDAVRTKSVRTRSWYTASVEPRMRVASFCMEKLKQIMDSETKHTIFGLGFSQKSKTEKTNHHQQCDYIHNIILGFPSPHSPAVPQKNCAYTLTLLCVCVKQHVIFLYISHNTYHFEEHSTNKSKDWYTS